MATNKNIQNKKAYKCVKILAMIVIITFIAGMSVFQVNAASIADLDGRYTVGVNISWVYVTSGSDTSTLAYIQKSDGTALGPVYCIDNTITASTAAGAYQAMLAQQDVVDSYKDFKYNYHGYEAAVNVEKILWVVRNGFSADGKPSAGGKSGTISDPSTVTWENNNINYLKGRFNIETLYIPEAYQATQLALWYYADPDEAVQNSLKLDKLKPNVKALYDALISGAEAAACPDSVSKPPLLPEISIDLSFEPTECDFNGCVGSVTVSIDQNPSGFIDINDIQITVELESGIEITENESGTAIDESMKSGQTFYVDIGETPLSEDIELLTINASVDESSKISDVFIFSAPNMNWAKQQTLIAAGSYKNSIDISASVTVMASDLGIQFTNSIIDGVKESEDSDDTSNNPGDDVVLIENNNNKDDNITPATTTKSAPTTGDRTDFNLWVVLLTLSTFVMIISISANRNLFTDKRFKFRIAGRRC